MIGGDLAAAARRIRAAREKTPQERSLLVAVSGIDGSGKGWVSACLAATLEAEGLRAAVVHADEWLNLLDTRFCRLDPARHFYRHAFRFDEMFGELVLPLIESRSIRVRPTSPKRPRRPIADTFTTSRTWTCSCSRGSSC